jgi:RNA-directed DNA polymerase
VIVHCVTERQARQVRAAIGDRLAEVGLELHPGKTKVGYCKDGRRRGVYEVISFTFLGYTFRPRKALHKNRKGSFTGFLPGVSAEKLTEMSRKAQAWKLNRRTTLTLAELARAINPVLAGWLAYFARFYPTAVIPLCKRMNRHLIRWAKRKYKRLERSSKRAWAWLAAVVERAPGLFAHWKYCATT